MENSSFPSKREPEPSDDQPTAKKTKVAHNDLRNASSSRRFSSQRDSQGKLIQNQNAAGSKTHPIVVDIESSSDDENSQVSMMNYRDTTMAAVVSSTSPLASQNSAETHDLASFQVYDACFGLLLLKATCGENIPIPDECTEVSLLFEQKLLRIFLKDSDERIGITVSKALCGLVSEFAVTLTATICGRKSSTNLKHGEFTYNIDNVRSCPLRVIVYGHLQQKESIASFLGKAGLFLQHPGANEFDRNVRYVNPHYLLAPGQIMPDIEKLSPFSCCSGQGRMSKPLRDALGELERSQILRIFDTVTRADEKILTTLEQSPRLSSELKRHQKEALVMMLEKEVGLYERAQFPAMWTPFINPNGTIRYQNIVTETFEMTCPPPAGGGILADEMGLGKTLSILSLICHSLDTLDNSPEPRPGLPRATLVITPKSTIYTWETQIKTHIHANTIRYIIYHGSKRHQLAQELGAYDIVLTTYDVLRSESAKSGSLLKQEWVRLVLDEAHRIRNSSSRTFVDVCRIQTAYRWCLTGTPIQNYLDDFGSLLAFTKIPPFDHSGSFYQYISGPITTRKKSGMELLRKVIAATCLRRTKGDHAATLNLPRKVEMTVSVRMDPKDRQLYEFFKRFSYLTAGSERNVKKKPAKNILVLISMLRRICNHGEALLPGSALTAWKRKDVNSLTWEILESSTISCSFCGRQLEEVDIAVMTQGSCRHAFCDDCASRPQSSSQQSVCPKCYVNAAESSSLSVINNPSTSQTSMKGTSEAQHGPSAKVRALIENISQRQDNSTSPTHPCKSVVFSHSTKMLDLLESALKNRNFQFRRIDGQCSLQQRREAIDNFNSNRSCTVMLASIGAAGEGIDLTVANSVHIVEPQWNPMAEAQAVDRVHRIGQKQDVEVIRYIVDNSIETYVQWVQRDKMRLISASFDPVGQSNANIHQVRWKKLMEYLE